MINRKKYPETAKFFDWIESEKKNSLVDFKFTLSDKKPKSSKREEIIEERCSELNRMLAAPEIEDKEFF